MAGELNPLDKIKECINSKKSFVLQGGAGSGKTESLKDILEFVIKNQPQARMACITHTNLAVSEISSRVDIGMNSVSTIHSFLNQIISKYKTNIHSVIFEIFKVPEMARSHGDENSAEYKKDEHEKFKKVHKKYSSMLFTIKKEAYEKVTGKRDYDKDPTRYNVNLNEAIAKLNSEIQQEIRQKDPRTISYNESTFDSYKDLTYGHNSLITIAGLLFNKYKTLGKILEDKFDFIFVDEYQDTHRTVVDIFLKNLPGSKKTTIGFFGDSMQAIYEDGIGDLEDYISAGILTKIEKEDNYRCSQPIIDLINKLRDDKLVQKLALKKNAEGYLEKAEERSGSVQLFYSLCDSRPNAFSPPEVKQEYSQKLDDLIQKATNGHKDYKFLMLTNKSISSKAEFQKIYDVFAERYMDPKEGMDSILERIQVTEIYKLIDSFQKRNYNEVYTQLKKQGFVLKKLEDKAIVTENLNKIIQSEKSLFDTLEMAFESKLIKRSDSYFNFVERRKNFLEMLHKDAIFQGFKTSYNEGNNTFTKMAKIDLEIDEDTFKEREKDVERENFFNNLFSDKVIFKEAYNYLKYAAEETNYITMHKTKGSSIPNVLVVLDEYFWNEYKFSSIFQASEADPEVRLRNLKLVYVACSRARNNLKCVRLVTVDEEAYLKTFFPDCIKV